MKQYKIKVITNPDFCGVDAGGVQFAHGEAIIESARMASWFQEHEGYSVEEVTKNTNDSRFSDMKVDELKAYAAEHNIDLGEATKKEDIISVISSAKNA
mgnify:CR=1 FL=1